MNSQLLTVSMYEPIRYEMFVLQWIELVQVKMHFQVLTNKLLHMFLQNNNTNILFLCFVSATAVGSQCGWVVGLMKCLIYSSARGLGYGFIFICNVFKLVCLPNLISNQTSFTSCFFSVFFLPLNQPSAIYIFFVKMWVLHAVFSVYFCNSVIKQRATTVSFTASVITQMGVGGRFWHCKYTRS